jgi:hypothetical protein
LIIGELDLIGMTAEAHAAHESVPASSVPTGSLVVAPAPVLVLEAGPAADAPPPPPVSKAEPTAPPPSAAPVVPDLVKSALVEEERHTALAALEVQHIRTGYVCALEVLGKRGRAAMALAFLHACYDACAVPTHTLPWRDRQLLRYPVTESSGSDSEDDAADSTVQRRDRRRQRAELEAKAQRRRLVLASVLEEHVDLPAAQRPTHYGPTHYGWAEDAVSQVCPLLHAAQGGLLSDDTCDSAARSAAATTQALVEDGETDLVLTLAAQSALPAGAGSAGLRGAARTAACACAHAQMMASAAAAAAWVCTCKLLRCHDLVRHGPEPHEQLRPLLEATVAARMLRLKAEALLRGTIAFIVSECGAATVNGRLRCAHSGCTANAVIPVDAHKRVIDRQDRILDLWGEETQNEGGAHQHRTELMGKCCGWYPAGAGCTGCGDAVGSSDGSIVMGREGWEYVDVSAQRPVRLFCPPCAAVCDGMGDHLYLHSWNGPEAGPFFPAADPCDDCFACVLVPECGPSADNSDADDSGAALPPL